MKNCSRFNNWKEAWDEFQAETKDCILKSGDGESLDLPGSKNCAGCADNDDSCFACWMYSDHASNNEVIDGPSYYTFPDGTQVEDEIARMPFWMGSLFKYVWRAGRKDGESEEKDIEKAKHYVRLGMRVMGRGMDETISVFVGHYAEAVRRHGVKYGAEEMEILSGGLVHGGGAA